MQYINIFLEKNLIYAKYQCDQNCSLKMFLEVIASPLI